MSQLIPHPKTTALEGVRSSSASQRDLDDLIRALEVTFVELAECLISSGWRLDFAARDPIGIHYAVAGSGRLVVNGHPPIDLRPHTLVIVPANMQFLFERADCDRSTAMRTVNDDSPAEASTALKRFVAGSDSAPLTVICGYMRASYGLTLNLFEPLRAPIVEHFDAESRLDLKLREAMAELVAQDVGAESMTAALLKLVLIPLLRRSALSPQLWTQRFGLLRDPQVSRAFAQLAAHPLSPHSVASLAEAAGLSRSAFMLRFRKAFGQPPVAVLRELRMQHAAALLATQFLPIDQIARACGFSDRRSFSRAFRRMYGVDPSEYGSTNGKKMSPPDEA